LPKADSRVGFAQQSLDSQKPGPRGAVKAREAPAKRLGLTWGYSRQGGVSIYWLID
jgi:hypothetical protein